MDQLLKVHMQHSSDSIQFQQCTNPKLHESCPNACDLPIHTYKADRVLSKRLIHTEKMIVKSST